jgi:hypothetical protein
MFMGALFAWTVDVADGGRLPLGRAESSRWMLEIELFRRIP